MAHETSRPLQDSALFDVSAAMLLEGVRSAGSMGEVEPSAAYILSRCGLVQDSALTDAGRALFQIAWVLRKHDEADRALGQALRILTPIQVIEQELRGLGPVPEAGVLDLLRQHRAVAEDATVEYLRPTFRWLSGVGVLVYSMKLKSIRSLAPAPDAALAGEIPSLAAMVSPKTPYLNLIRLRRVIRQLRGLVWWADPHFGTRALEELAEELDPAVVSELRILSGDAENVVSPKSLRDYERFRTELGIRGITVEWRVDNKSSRDWHDRWIADDSQMWNVPPINTLLKNDYSELTPTSERPPLAEWWSRSTPR